jgi:hypothetical protein
MPTHCSATMHQDWKQLVDLFTIFQIFFNLFITVFIMLLNNPFNIFEVFFSVFLHINFFLLFFLLFNRSLCFILLFNLLRCFCSFNGLRKCSFIIFLSFVIFVIFLNFFWNFSFYWFNCLIFVTWCLSCLFRQKRLVLIRS